MNDNLIPLSEAQAHALGRLDRGEKVTSLPPITRQWLFRHGLITVKPLGRGRFDIKLTPVGKDTIALDRAYRKRKQSQDQADV